MVTQSGIARLALSVYLSSRAFSQLLWLLPQINLHLTIRYMLLEPNIVIIVSAHDSTHNVAKPSVASFTKEGNPWLAKRPLAFNGRLANRWLTSLVKEATVDCLVAWFPQTLKSAWIWMLSWKVRDFSMCLENGKFSLKSAWKWPYGLQKCRHQKV